MHLVLQTFVFFCGIEIGFSLLRMLNLRFVPPCRNTGQKNLHCKLWPVPKGEDIDDRKISFRDFEQNTTTLFRDRVILMGTRKREIEGLLMTFNCYSVSQIFEISCHNQPVINLPALLDWKFVSPILLSNPK